MRQKINTLLFFMFIFAVFSCQKEQSQFNSDPAYLVGNWINAQYSDSVITFDRSTELIEGAYGLALKSGSELVERKNSGWCGTPPISYGDYSGNWSENDSIINIEVGYWGGEAKLTWKVISISNSTLIVHRLAEEYENP